MCFIYFFIVIYLRPFNHVKMALHSHLFMFILYKKGFLKNTHKSSKKKSKVLEKMLEKKNVVC